LAFLEKIKVSYLCLSSTADSSVVRLVLRAQLEQSQYWLSYHTQKRGKAWMWPKCPMWCDIDRHVPIDIKYVSHCSGYLGLHATINYCIKTYSLLSNKLTLSALNMILPIVIRMTVNYSTEDNVIAIGRPTIRLFNRISELTQYPNWRISVRYILPA